MSVTTKQPLVGALSEYFFSDILNIPSEARDWLRDVEDEEQLTNDGGEPITKEYRALLEAFITASAPNRVSNNTFNVVLNDTRYYVTVETEFEYNYRSEMAEFAEDHLGSVGETAGVTTKRFNELADREVFHMDPAYELLLEYVSESIHAGDGPTLADFKTFLQEYPDHDNEEKLGPAIEWANGVDESEWREQAELAVGEYSDSLATPQDQEGK